MEGFLNTLKETGTDSLPSALGLDKTGELISIVGGGGKSALLFALGRTLHGRTLLTTTTRIFTAQLARADRHCRCGPTELHAAIEAKDDSLLVIGDIAGGNATGVPVSLPSRLLKHPGVDFVVVEADGSRMRPTKAPASHEPVVPAETTLLVVVAGIDALEEKLSLACHRPELVSDITGLGPDQRLTPEHLARLLSDPRGGLKSAPTGGRSIVFLNKVETQSQEEQAREAARHILHMSPFERVVFGALESGLEADEHSTPESPPGSWRILERKDG
ncbi:MAG: putative selenium-dependent hydroxylase accessory protein YqeC [Deltaproteobacteria bacterium]|nr:putative selenium-dependent hydroxylase accessory protein YqeC [Deltaproteobacteria bacterium]MBW2386511.1 putative selenium-dependent hydroxylase accessory protein YqeC [Deltaproteobacteria bacterium]MBW2695081.1 putative selenium-dependent hydroxylase accessory protein YqeC [Deltaproteobacteria bacterium]